VGFSGTISVSNYTIKPQDKVYVIGFRQSADHAKSFLKGKDFVASLLGANVSMPLAYELLADPAQYWVAAVIDVNGDHPGTDDVPWGFEDISGHHPNLPITVPEKTMLGGVNVPINGATGTLKGTISIFPSYTNVGPNDSLKIVLSTTNPKDGINPIGYMKVKPVDFSYDYTINTQPGSFYLAAYFDKGDNTAIGSVPDGDGRGAHGGWYFANKVTINAGQTTSNKNVTVYVP